MGALEFTFWLALGLPPPESLMVPWLLLCGVVGITWWPLLRLWKL